MATDLEYAVQGAFIVDWLQTRSITRHPVLDRQLSHAGQLWFEGGTLAAELLCIVHNKRLGASLSF